MRRASTITLLAVIGYLLFAPLTFATAESNLPKCCRRAGAHHCAMAADVAAPTGSRTFQSVQQKCPMFPAAVPTPAGGHLATPVIPDATFAALVSRPAAPLQTEAPCRVSFSRSHQKRGPPLNLC